MVKKEEKTTWTCDRCHKEHVGEKYPQKEGNNWGKLKIDQDSGFDMQGCANAPRMREWLLLCGDCIEDIVVVVNA